MLYRGVIWGLIYTFKYNKLFLLYISFKHLCCILTVFLKKEKEN